MPRLLFIALILGSMLLTGGCGSAPTYKITLKDGREFIAASKPKMQRKTGYYRYQNFQGRDALIRAEEVLLIESAQ
jgi:hypothetical protein